MSKVKCYDLKKIQEVKDQLLDSALAVQRFMVSDGTLEDERQFLKELNAVVHHYLLGDFIYASLGIPIKEIEDLGI